MKIRNYFTALVFNLVIINFSFGQLSGTYTVGGINPDYSTFIEVRNDLWYSGISGDVIFNIRPGVYNERVYIDNVTGPTNYSITFQSENADSTSVEITCDSCDNSFTFYNMNKLILKNLTISISNSNDEALRGSYHMDIENCNIYGTSGADSLTVKNTNFFHADSTFYNAFSHLSYIELLNNNFFSEVRISYPENCIVKGNHFWKYTQITYADTIEIEENSFEEELKILQSSDSKIIGNIFNYSLNLHYSSRSQIIENYFPQSNGNIGLGFSGKSKLIGNKIFIPTNIVLSDSCKVYNNFFYNTLSLNNGYKALIYQNNFSLDESSYLILESENNVVKNNNFSHSVYGSIYNNAIENNNYYPSGGLYDLSPTNFDPQYIDTADIHAQNPLISGIGVYLLQVQYDIDSIIRPNPPTIGANEICLSNDTVNLFCGDSITLSFCNKPSSGSFEWNTSYGLNINNYKVSPAFNTLYILTETQSNFSDSVFVNVIPYQVEAFSDTLINCGDSIYLFANHNANATYQWTPTTDLFTPNSIHTIAKPDETTSYVVSASVPGCGVTYDTITISVDPLPRVFVSYTPSCLTAIFQNNSTCATDYYWDFGDSIISTEINPSHTYDTSGTYLITIIAYNSFGSDTIIGTISVNCNTSSIPQNLGDELKFEYYPNPTSGNLTLKFDYGNTFKEVGIQLIDVTGREIYSQNQIPILGKCYHIIDMSSNSNGIYFLKIRVRDNLTSYKVILSK